MITGRRKYFVNNKFPFPNSFHPYGNISSRVSLETSLCQSWQMKMKIYHRRHWATLDKFQVKKIIIITMQDRHYKLMKEKVSLIVMIKIGNGSFSVFQVAINPGVSMEKNQLSFKSLQDHFVSQKLRSFSHPRRRWRKDLL